MNCKQTFQLSFPSKPIIHFISKDELQEYWLQFLDTQAGLEETTITADFLYLLEDS